MSDYISRHFGKYLWLRALRAESRIKQLERELHDIRFRLSEADRFTEEYLHVGDPKARWVCYQPGWSLYDAIHTILFGGRVVAVAGRDSTIAALQHGAAQEGRDGTT